MLLRFVFLAVLGSIMACGRDDEAALLPESAAESVQLASPAEVEAGVVVPHSYLVAFRNVLDDKAAHFGSFRGAFLAHMSALAQRWARPAQLSSVRYLSSLNLNHLGASFAPARAVAPAPLLQQQPFADERLASLIEVSFPSEAIAQQTLQEWQQNGRIWYAEPNYKGDLKGELEDRLVTNFQGNTSTPWLEEINFVQAIQNLATVENKSNPPQLIAVMDSGVDVEHPNLKDAVFQNTFGQNKQNCKDDLYGCNTTKFKKGELGDGAVNPTGTSGFNESCPDASSQCGHGTHVAGIIAARDSEEFTGICPYCKILVVKVVEIEKIGGKESFSIPDAAIIAGLAYISGFKEGGEPSVRVINASFGKFERSRSVELFVRALRQFGRGTIVVAAAGNEDTMKRAYPAGFEDVISVSNVDSNAALPLKSPSSNFGMWVDISAPGDGDCPGGGSRGIFSTIPGNETGCKIGTSMAAPIVSGVAGLLLTKEPNLTANQVESRLKDTAVAQRLYADGVNNGYRPLLNRNLVPLLGSGVVNAEFALSPEKFDLPSITTDRVDRVGPGCGVIAGGAGGSYWLAVFLGLLPLLVVGFSRRRD